MAKKIKHQETFLEVIKDHIETEIEGQIRGELIENFHNTLGKNSKINIKIPYALGLMGGYCYDILAKITGKTYPISSIRIKKFSANTVINVDELKQTGFVPSYTLTEGLTRMIKSEVV